MSEQKTAKLLAGNRDYEVVSSVRLISGLFLLCLAVRLFLALNTAVVGEDAASLLWGVRSLEAGAPYDDLIRNKFLFQYIIHRLEPVFEDPVMAGYAVTVFFSSLTTVFLFLLFRDYFSTSVAVLAVLLYILHPAINSEHTKIITDGTFTCFYIGAAFLFHRYVYVRRRWKVWGYLIASFVLSGLAVATRPEGALLFLIHIITLCGLNFRAFRDNKINWSALAGLVFYVLVPVFAGIYFLGDPFLNVLGHPGEYSGDVGYILAVLTGEASVNPLRKWSWYRAAIYAFWELSYYHLNLFLLIGLFATSWKALPRERLLYHSYYVLYFVAVLLCALGSPRSDYINMRFFMVGFILLLPLIAGGISWTYERIQTGLGSRKTALAMLAIVLIALLPPTIKRGLAPRNTPDIGLKKAGQWVREHHGDQNFRILSTRKNAAYYTGVNRSRVERVQDLPGDTLDRLLEHTSADILLFSEKDLGDYTVLKETAEHDNLTLLHTTADENENIDTAYVYRISGK